MKKSLWKKRRTMHVWRFDKYQIWGLREGNKKVYDLMFGHVFLARLASPEEAIDAAIQHDQNRRTHNVSFNET